MQNQLTFSGRNNRKLWTSKWTCKPLWHLAILLLANWTKMSQSFQNKMWLQLPIFTFRSYCHTPYCDLPFMKKKIFIPKTVSFSIILQNNLSSLRINHSWDFINYLCHSKIFLLAQSLTFLDDHKVPYCTLIIFIMGKVHFSFIEELQ